MFKNRKEAGQLLGKKLFQYKTFFQSAVLAIPRGGVIVADQIARKLNLPLSVIIVKKLGAPANPELAIGALAPDGVCYFDYDMLSRLVIEEDYLRKEIKEKSQEIKEREKKYQTINIEKQIRNQDLIILVDDGVATGATVLAAVKYIKQKAGSVQSSPISYLKIILAVPVIARDTYNQLKSKVDQIIALEIADCFSAVGQFYQEFDQVSDEEVICLLKNRNQN